MNLYEPEAPADRCAGCAELLDRDDTVCRLCGEDNSGETGDSEFSAEGPTDTIKLDRLGSWSQLKHVIITDYASVYTKILSKQRAIRKYVYIEGFAGAGTAFDRRTNKLIQTSALQVLGVKPPFSEYHLIELNPRKAKHLAAVTQEHTRVFVHTGSCDEVLRTKVLPRCRYEQFARALCILDPYGLTVGWDLIKAIAAQQSIEIVFNFMVVSANRNVLYADRSRVSEVRKALLDFVWGDRTWEAAAYREEADLFGGHDEKVSTREFVRAYCDRLRTVARFGYVPEPVPMRNDRGATMYYLIFAGHNRTGGKIVNEIFRKYERDL